MNQVFDRRRLALQIGITISVLMVLVLAIRDFYQVAEGTTNWMSKFTITWGIPLAGMIFFGVLAFVFGTLILWMPERIDPHVRTLARWRDRLAGLRWLVFVVLALIPAKIFLYTPLGFKLVGSVFRLAFLLAVVIAMAIFATRDQDKLIRWRPLMVSAIFSGLIFAGAKEFVHVTDYPFSLTWSEGNRIWDYSWLYGRRLYDYPLEAKFEAYIDIGRQSLWGLPFIFDNVSILDIRIWSAIVLTVPYILLGWLVFRPLPGKLKDWVWLGLWAFTFLYQGPIYTPLVLSAILVAGARRKPIWLALPLIYLAGFYAQLSRLTWMVAPAIWAGMVALVDGINQNGLRFTWRDWLRVTVYGLAGFLGGVGIQRGWNRVASYLGNVSEVNSEAAVPEVTFTDTTDAVEAVSSGSNTFLTDQPLLWDRLWPNSTYGLGIVIGLILAAAPLIIFLVYLVQTKRWKINAWQKSGLAAGLLVFLGLGMVISVKIGGGGNLHNLDMFLVGALIVAGLAWEHDGHETIKTIETQGVGVKLIIFLMVLIPAFTPMIGAHPLELPEEKHILWAQEVLGNETKRIQTEGGEILFMDQRQLLTFRYLQVALIPEYEKKQVMDRALAGDVEYFTPFYDDLAKQRFSLIVVDPQRIRYTDETEDWSEENNAWVQWVTEPLFCFYEPKFTFDHVGIWTLYPLEEVEDCSVQQ